MDIMTTRAIEAYDQADDDTKNAGYLWYPNAQSKALSFHTDIDISAGVIAALSPQSDWDTNMRNAAQLLKTGELYQNVPGAFKFKALKIIDHAAQTNTLLTGPKERAFFYSIKYPDHRMYPACIDRHMIKLLTNNPNPTDADLRITPKQYERFSQAVCKAAHHHDTSIPAMQATLWIYQRGKAS